MKSDQRIFLGLGTNLGDRSKNLANAILQIETQVGKILAQSSVYVSAPFGFKADTDFFNQVISLESQLDPLELLAKIKSIESQIGRIKTKESGYESRIIDLDIIDYKGQVFPLDDLAIPHNQMHLRHFVLLPLAEIEPRWTHPVSGQSVSQLIQQLDSSQNAEKTGVAND
ncbi:MAG: 2-amino-4-hydroxy-6-hydroxymethyldihydropteridine diphosphokinase [Crocinitomicaceae bacterium]|nr:2-amino-4-hydroxy-6-hydroxymethyldihydropteridine diphosphokinase [Crocinitomicaceae bacterium]